MDCSLPGSSVHGMLQARILEWSGIKPRSPACRRILYHPNHQGSPSLYYLCCCYCLVAKSYPTLCDPMNYSTPVYLVHGISQARIQEWVAISFSRGSSQPRNWTCVSCIGRQILYHWATREALILFILVIFFGGLYWFVSAYEKLPISWLSILFTHMFNCGYMARSYNFLYKIKTGFRYASTFP